MAMRVPRPGPLADIRRYRAESEFRYNLVAGLDDAMRTAQALNGVVEK